MAESQKLDVDYGFKFREDEELEFFTELAVHECERWIQAVTKKSLSYPDDTRKSLENGVLLCELLNSLQPGSVSRINRLSTPIAGLDNINVFLQACKTNFGLSDVHLFDPSDLEDLSQRAIAESAYLKQEYERRLRNVAVTIYWLGKFANRYYQGPHLDLSAFSALIHHRQEPDSVEREFHPESRYISSTSSSSSADWPHGSHLSAYGQPGTVAYSDSLEETASDVCSNMSVNHYSSSVALNKSQEKAKDQNQSIYSSTPDLSLRGSSHRRYSSMDSLEDSYYSGHSGGQSGHSRQGSNDSQEVIYPTRRANTQILRKQSSTTDPLQFIKTKGAQDLAHTAEVQMRVAAESKKGAVLSVVKDDDDDDWQSELNSWKSRRKSQSERSYHMKEQLEEMEKEKSGETFSAHAPKTFSQMQAEREQRRSTKKFYPIDDDGDNYGDDDAFIPTVSRQLHNRVNLSNDGSNEKSLYTREKEDYTEGDKTRETARASKKSATQSHSDANNNYSNVSKRQHDNKDLLPSSTFQTALTQKSPNDGDHVRSYRQAGHDRLSKQGKSGEDAKFGVSLSSFDGGHSLLRDSRDEGVPSRENNSSYAVSEAGGRNEAIYKTREVSTANKLQSERDVMAVKSSRNIGSRTQSKIGSILQNFEDSTSKSSMPKEGYNEKINLHARRSAFENVSENDYRHDSSFSHSEDVVSEESGDDSLQEVGFHSHQPKVMSVVTTSVVTTSTVTSTSTPPSSLPTVTPPVSSAQGHTSTTNTQQDYVNKTIKISQKANSEKGFGFFLSGGADKQTTLYVSKVVLGSAADVCDLKTRDAIQSVNQTDVSAMTAAEVGEIISSAVGQGYIEINVWREKDEDDYDEFGSSSDEGEEIISSPGYILHQTQEIKDQARNEDRKPDVSVTTSSLGSTRSHATPSGGSRFSQNSPDSHRDEGDETDFGPPALLRRWQQQQQQQQQQQRQKEDTYDDDISKFYSKINLNTSFSRSESERDQELSANQETGYGRSEGWSNKIVELTKTDAEEDEQREKEKVRILEERRAERRARIMNSTSPGSSATPAQAPAQEVRASSQEVRASPQEVRASPQEVRASVQEVRASSQEVRASSQEVRASAQEVRASAHETPALPSQTWSPAIRAQASPQGDQRQPPQTWTSAPQPWVPLSQTQPSLLKARSSPIEIQTSVQQSWKAPSQTRPSPPEIRPSPPEIRPSPPENQPSPTEIQTPVPQSWKAPLQTRPSPPEIRPSPTEFQISLPQSWTAPSQTRVSPANQISLPSQTLTPVHMVVSKTFDGAVLQQERSTASPDVNSFMNPGSNSSSQTLLPSGYQTVKFVIDPRNKFVIDPRNRQGSSEALQPVDMQPRYDYQANPSTEVSILLEEERERIRNEELRRLKEERQRAEEELLRKEKEERLRLQKEEEEIQKERELIRLEREKLLKEKEEFNRLKEQQTQQQQFYQPRKHQEASYEPNYQTNAYNNKILQSNKASSPPPDQNTFQPILSQQDQRQTTGYNPQQRNELQNRPGVFHPQSVHSGTQQEQIRNFPATSVNAVANQERAHSQNTELYSQAQIQQGSHHQYPTSSGLPSRPSTISNIQTVTKNYTDPSRNDLDSSRSGRRFSREEILVMNRTARPMVSVASDPRDSHNDSQWSGGPITREAPSREEIHSLNSVPKAKLRRDTDWQSTESLNSPRTPKSISPHQPETSLNKAPWYQGREEKPGSKFSLFTSGDHWLVQEAERRRIAESEAKLPPGRATNQRPSSSGPIKPTGDTSNRWRDQGGFGNEQNHVSERLRPSSSMPAVIRQTLLQKTAGARGSNEPIQTFPHSTSPTSSLQYHNNHHNQLSPSQPPQQAIQKRQQWQNNQHVESSRHPQQQGAPGGPAAPPQRQHEIKMSGSQLCSHCEQELGYGAAMVIESLGLFFHVQCFRCWVCHASLGTGDQGADVRVRVNKLHCPNCYSNDEVGLKFSKV